MKFNPFLLTLPARGIVIRNVARGKRGEIFMINGDANADVYREEGEDEEGSAVRESSCSFATPGTKGRVIARCWQMIWVDRWLRTS
jgi:hypothetical protein